MQGDLLEVSLTCQVNTGVKVFDLNLVVVDLNIIGMNELRTTGLTVFFLDLGELRGNECLYLKLVSEYLLDMSDLSLKSLDLVYSVDNILLVKVTQLDIGNVFRLYLVNTKA